MRKNKTLRTALCGAALTAVSLPAWSVWLFHQGIQTPQSMDTPVTFSHADCEFVTQIFQNGQFEPVILNDAMGCSQPHVLVIDQTQYPLSPGYAVSFDDLFYDFGSATQLGICSTGSGDPINTNTPLMVDGQSIGIDQNTDVQYKTIAGVRHWFFHSINGDVSCDMGQPFVIDDIFKNGFE